MLNLTVHSRGRTVMMVDCRRKGRDQRSWEGRVKSMRV